MTRDDATSSRARPARRRVQSPTAEPCQSQRQDTTHGPDLLLTDMRESKQTNMEEIAAVDAGGVEAQDSTSFDACDNVRGSGSVPAASTDIQRLPELAERSNMNINVDCEGNCATNSVARSSESAGLQARVQSSGVGNSSGEFKPPKLSRSNVSTETLLAACTDPSADKLRTPDTVVPRRSRPVTRLTVELKDVYEKCQAVRITVACCF